jgi:hypothetical protein
MTPEKEERARKLINQFFDECEDLDVAYRIYNEEKRARIKRRDAPPSRIVPQRQGRIRREANAIVASMERLTELGWSDRKIKKNIIEHWPMSNDSYYKLIDESSACTYPRNKKP